jgi:hypothetical protein
MNATNLLTTILKTNTRVGEDLVSSRRANREDTRSSPAGNNFEKRWSLQPRGLPGDHPVNGLTPVPGQAQKNSRDLR